MYRRTCGISIIFHQLTALYEIHIMFHQNLRYFQKILKPVDSIYQHAQALKMWRFSPCRVEKNQQISRSAMISCIWGMRWLQDHILQASARFATIPLAIWSYGVPKPGRFCRRKQTMFEVAHEKQMPTTKLTYGKDFYDLIKKETVEIFWEIWANVIYDLSFSHTPTLNPRVFHWVAIVASWCRKLASTSGNLR